MHLQRITVTGVKAWGPEGVLVGGAPIIDLRLASDAKGGAIVVWNEPGDKGPFGLGIPRAQRISAQGAIMVWPADGMFRGQRLDSLGASQWGPCGVPLDAISSFYDTELCPDQAGGTILAWSQEAANGFIQAFAQRISGSSGARLWRTGGLPVGPAAGAQLSVSIVPSTPGSAIVSWSDGRTGSDKVYAQRVLSDGVAWVQGGKEVCIASGNQSVTAMCSDRAGDPDLAGRPQLERDLLRDLRSPRLPVWATCLAG